MVRCAATEGFLVLVPPLDILTLLVPLQVEPVQKRHPCCQWSTQKGQKTQGQDDAASMLSPSPPAFNHSQHQGLFQRVSNLHQVAKVLEFQLQHQCFYGYSGLISFRMDWLQLLAVQGTHKSLLQHQSSKASILRRSAFFTVQLSHPYVTTGKT